jgi:acyl carrier protein
MTDEQITRFLAVVRRNLKSLDAAELPMDANLESLGLDSVSALTLMLDLEEAFGVVFDPSMFTEETFATPESLWLALSSLRQ